MVGVEQTCNFHMPSLVEVVKRSSWSWKQQAYRDRTVRVAGLRFGKTTKKSKNRLKLVPTYICPYIVSYKWTK
jgi:hypothetical protein